MKKSFLSHFKRLSAIAINYDETSLAEKEEIINVIHKSPLPKDKKLIQYQDLLLFLAAHSHNKAFHEKLEKEIKRISAHLKKTRRKSQNLFLNSGLPFTETHASLTHDTLKQLSEGGKVILSYDSSEEETVELNTILSFTLPDAERDYTTAGCDQEELFSLLKIKDKARLEFLMTELDKLNHVPFIKDYLLDKFNLYVNIKPKSEVFSKLFNKIPVKETYFHSEILKKFDHLELINKRLSAPVQLGSEEINRLTEVMQNALALLQRETDPCTFIDKKTLRYYQLERGISVAIFGMIPERQLSMESYVGYTLFKNGYPAAYGGSWVFGKRALFGINIFEQFRGGESGFIFIQLLRTYKQAFNLNYFEVEPYQYGLDNPEGIESGAFWFYYRYGFRPLDKKLYSLAEKEAKKIKTGKGCRSSKKTLERFTESNIGWLLENKKTASTAQIRNKITTMISGKYNSNRNSATEDSFKYYLGEINKNDFSPEVIKTLHDFVLIAKTFNLKASETAPLIRELTRLKSTDPYEYNKLLSEFISGL